MFKAERPPNLKIVFEDLAILDQRKLGTHEAFQPPKNGKKYPEGELFALFTVRGHGDAYLISTIRDAISGGSNNISEQRKAAYNQAIRAAKPFLEGEPNL